MYIHHCVYKNTELRKVDEGDYTGIFEKCKLTQYTDYCHVPWKLSENTYVNLLVNIISLALL